MSSESDGSGRSDDIVIIKELLQKLEQAAARDAETPREEPAAETVAEAAREEPPLLVLRSNRSNAPSQSALASGSQPIALPEFAHSPVSVDVPAGDSASVTVPADRPSSRRRPGAVVAGASFALGIVAAGALIIAFDPFGSRRTATTVAQRPVAALPPLSILRGPPGSATEPGPAAAAEAAQQATANATKTSVPERTAGEKDTVRERTLAQGAASVEAGAIAARIGLRIAARIELKAGERRSIDASVDAPAGDVQRLLVVFRQVPGWMTFSRGGAIGNDIWLLPAQQVGDLEVEAGEGAQGAADVKVQLARVDGSILSETSVSFVATSSAPSPSTAGGIASGGSEATILRLQARGELLLDTGEIEAARTLLRTAAEAGSVAAALRLAETYDPAEIQRLGMAERSADLGQAVRWYEHAQALGSPVAAARLIALGRR